MMKEKFRAVGQLFLRFVRRMMSRMRRCICETPFWACVILALLLNFFVEMLSRHSLVEAVVHVCTKPLSFVCNAMIILLTLSVSLFFRRRVFFMATISSVWLLLGIANAVVLLFRATPLSAVDFQIMQTAVLVINHYLDTIHYILIALLLLTLIGASVLLWRKAPEYRPNLTRTLPIFLVVLVATYCSASIAAERMEAQGGFTNLVDANDRFGFAYCFTQSLLDEGIDEPDGYSPELVNAVLKNFSARPEAPQNEQLPNIIFLQLESFFDPQLLSGVAFAQNPLPTFTALRSVYPSGYLTVPTVGAGTVNTEFEILTGMSLEFFGTGEYPYKTVLKERTCESLARDLKTFGYSTTAMHNNDGLFYQRNEIFPQFGFDRYVSVEYMRNVEYNPTHWPRDAVLTDEIVAVLNETTERDFIYAISVQDHGKYESDPALKEGNFTAYGIDDIDQKIQMEYYVGQLAQTDAFLAELIDSLNRSGEPYVLVMFGDHLPTLEQVNVEQLSTHSLYQTEYIICNNIGLAFEDQDLMSYQLAARVMDALGYPGSCMMRLHNSPLTETTEHYAGAMHILQYDLLYGERYASGGVEPERSDMQMGLYRSEITGVATEDAELVVTGTHFTPFAQITVNDETVETVFVSETELRTAFVPEEGDLISVCFIGENPVVLSQTDSVTY